LAEISILNEGLRRMYNRNFFYSLNDNINSFIKEDET